MATIPEDLLTIAHLTGMDPRDRREMMDTAAETEEILTGLWMNED